MFFVSVENTLYLTNIVDFLVVTVTEINY